MEIVRQVSANRELDAAEVRFDSAIYVDLSPNSNLYLMNFETHSPVLLAKYMNTLKDGMELPANWQPGDQVLPTSLEDKLDFLGIDDKQSEEEEEEERGGHMGEAKVEQ